MIATWTRAQGTDVMDMVEFSEQMFGTELNDIYTVDAHHGACELTLGIVRQFYNPTSELIMTARDQGQLVAWLWVVRGQYTPWSSDEIASVNMLHLDLTRPVRDRIRLVEQAIDIWEVWADVAGIPVISSASVREDSAGFLRIHQRRGYKIYGSVAYKRLELSR